MVPATAGMTRVKRNAVIISSARENPSMTTNRLIGGVLLVLAGLMFPVQTFAQKRVAVPAGQPGQVIEGAPPGSPQPGTPQPGANPEQPAVGPDGKPLPPGGKPGEPAKP